MEFVNLYVTDILRLKSGGLAACCRNSKGERFFCDVDTKNKTLRLIKQRWEWVPSILPIKDYDKLRPYNGRGKSSLIKQLNHKIVQGNIFAAHDLLMRLSEDIIELLPLKDDQNQNPTSLIGGAQIQLTEILRKSDLATELLDNAIDADPSDGFHIP